MQWLKHTKDMCTYQGSQDSLHTSLICLRKYNDRHAISVQKQAISAVTHSYRASECVAPRTLNAEKRREMTETTNPFNLERWKEKRKHKTLCHFMIHFSRHRNSFLNYLSVKQHLMMMFCPKELAFTVDERHTPTLSEVKRRRESRQASTTAQVWGRILRSTLMHL